MKNTHGKCPVAYALDIFGDRWSLLIVRDIIFKGKRHYGEFVLSSEKISTNILASRLTKLEAEDILTKQRDPENLAKFVYDLTQKGKDLLPIMLEMIVWSAKYDPPAGGSLDIISGAPADLLERSQSDRQALLDELLKGLR